jgi:hypothetical protein
MKVSDRVMLSRKGGIRCRAFKQVAFGMEKDSIGSDREAVGL